VLTLLVCYICLVLRSLLLNCGSLLTANHLNVSVNYRLITMSFVSGVLLSFWSSWNGCLCYWVTNCQLL